MATHGTMATRVSPLASSLATPTCEQQSAHQNCCRYVGLVGGHRRAILSALVCAPRSTVRALTVMLLRLRCGTRSGLKRAARPRRASELPVLRSMMPRTNVAGGSRGGSREGRRGGGGRRMKAEASSKRVAQSTEWRTRGEVFIQRVEHFPKGKRQHFVTMVNKRKAHAPARRSGSPAKEAVRAH